MIITRKDIGREIIFRDGTFGTIVFFNIPEAPNKAIVVAESGDHPFCLNEDGTFYSEHGMEDRNADAVSFKEEKIPKNT